MRKFLLVLMMVAATFTIGVPEAMAGIVNGNVTKIRAYEDGNKIRFESRVPNVDIIWI